MQTVSRINNSRPRFALNALVSFTGVEKTFWGLANNRRVKKNSKKITRADFFCQTKKFATFIFIAFLTLETL